MPDRDGIIEEDQVNEQMTGTGGWMSKYE